MFLFGYYLESYFEKRPKIIFTKIYQADFDFHCQELSNGGLGVVVALLASSGINFPRAYTGANSAVEYMHEVFLW